MDKPSKKKIKSNSPKKIKSNSPIPPSPVERGLRGEVFSLSELPSAAKQLLQSCSDKKIFAFYGEMGSGKTTFIKVICETLGVTDMISSPTFSIVNEYRTSKDQKIFHFDFYRIKSINEAYDMGYEDYFYSDAYCFIEWPEKIMDLLPENYVKVKISTQSDQPEQSSKQRLIEWSFTHDLS